MSTTTNDVVLDTLQRLDQKLDTILQGNLVLGHSLQGQGARIDKLQKDVSKLTADVKELKSRVSGLENKIIGEVLGDRV
jgi:polyhydroxyalkanoate synthesis regulator phasin